MAKMLIASPTYNGMEYCEKRFLGRIKELSCRDYDILIVDNSGGNDYFEHLRQDKRLIVMRYDGNEKDKIKRLIGSRNKILDYAAENNYDCILMMDSDVIPPKNVVEELMKCKKDIVSGVYFSYFKSSGILKILPVAFMPISKEEFEQIRIGGLPEFVKSNKDLRRHMTKEEIESNSLIKVLFPSAGCMLLTRKVFENKNIRYGLLKIEADAQTSDDIYFITKARENGIDAYVNTAVKCDHLVSGKYIKDSDGSFRHPVFE